MRNEELSKELGNKRRSGGMILSPGRKPRLQA